MHHQTADYLKNIKSICVLYACLKINIKFLLESCDFTTLVFEKNNDIKRENYNVPSLYNSVFIILC